MSRHMYLAFLVLITLFQCILVVSRSAVCTDSFPLKVIKLPPAVMRIWYGSSFWGQKSTTGLAYVKNFHAASACWISSCIITNIAFVPFWPILLSPCAILLKSFPNAVCQTLAVAGSFINFLQLEMVSPVTGWTMGLAYQA